MAESTFKVKSEEFNMEAKVLANLWKVDPRFTCKRRRFVKRHFDELSSDYRFSNSEEIFKVKVYYYTLDKIIVQTHKRFNGMRTINHYLAFLEPKNILTMSQQNMVKACDTLCCKYLEVFTSNLANQFVQLTTLLKLDLKHTMTIKQLAIMTTKYSVLESDFSKIYMTVLLFFTLPVTVASVERSFNKLKIIKDYKRNATTQSRLHPLALLDIEHKTASTMDVKEVENIFANAKARKKVF
ncbi:uncharacterized protein LOC136084957 [Hydra vulgaris]|uniref:Uncharacterized protein LOC136084957 n=1 Tax=Hydra vulgaris TaxID=6087 RepID=A0ABM4CKX5_HYDVU